LTADVLIGAVAMVYCCRPAHQVAHVVHREQIVIRQVPIKGSDKVKVSFILPKSGDKVSVVGDFNGWDPLVHPLRARSNGTRSVIVTLPAGRRFAFRYLGEDGRWHDDETAAFEPNGIGGLNCVIQT